MSAASLPAEPAEAWDAELAGLATPAPLLQSFAWGEVQASAGWEVHRIRLPGHGPVTLLAQGSGILRWGYAPRGPAGNAAGMLQALVAWARQNGLSRLRVEPEVGPAAASDLEGIGFRRGEDVQPRRTRIIPLADEETMLASFRRTTRYNIRLAERKGVVVEAGAEPDELARQVAASAARAGVRLPGRDYLQLLLDRLPGSRTFVARYQGEALCALMVAYHDGRGYYLFSGANGSRRELKAMDLAMWAGIRYAAAAGCRDYDLWGVPPPDQPSHPWHGFGEFKRGYGGEEVEYVGTWDLVLSSAGNAAIEAREKAVRAVRRLRR